ncbi:MAG: trypsin-like peptidase domain-containing protein [Planctomycetaceae bacterium]|jgi:S1-C subfamily serine protease|nr:trypsin-like peptidase domain-containing protein [Planctomycetaceae bacterium]
MSRILRLTVPFAVLSAVLLQCVPPLLFADESSPADENINKAMQATVAVFPANPDAQAGGGSGVVISPDGYAVTNFHVVQPCGPAMKCGMADGKLYDTVLVGLDPVGDIALIKLLGRSDFPFAKFADSDGVSVGNTAFVMGNPFLLAIDLKPCVSKGIISGTHRYQFPAGSFLEYTDCLQTDAAVNPGNSGGPLFNDKGEIIGIIGRCSFEKRGRVNVGIGYAVSANQVRYFLGDLKSGRIVDHATLNAVVMTDNHGRVVIDEVQGTSDAARSGLRYGDEILRFAGHAVDSVNTYKNLIGIYPKHWRLPVTARGSEDGKRYDVQVRLGGLHGETELIEMTEKMIAPPIKPELKENEDGKPVLEMKQGEIYLSEAVKPFYEKRKGYANFHFNKIETARVLKLINAADPFKSETEWKMTGKLKDKPDTFSFRITDKGLHWELPNGQNFWNADLMQETKEFVIDPISHYKSPRGSNGLFTALYLYRLLTVAGKIEDADIAYTGTAPVGGNLGTLYDVLTVTWRGNDVKFFSDPQTGSVMLIEMSGDALDFPCEVYFSEKTMEVRNGKLIFGVFETEKTFNTVKPSAPPVIPHPVLSPVIAGAVQKSVKIYGAEAAGIHGYQSGILISPDGFILTALTAALQADPIQVVLDSGRKFDAKLADADPVMEIALLKITASDLPFFALPDEVKKPELGLPVYAVSNSFNIAQGNEPVTVQFGHIAVQTKLSARRGVFETPYKGDIFVLDITTNNPGSCGGALISAETGELLGILGKELRNNENHSWLNFSIPSYALRDSVQKMLARAGKENTAINLFTDKAVRDKELIPEDTIKVFQNWGILLVPAVNRRTPPFIESIRSGSEAEQSGLRPDDLIVMVNDQLTASLAAIEYRIHQLPPEQPVTLTVERDGTLVEVKFPKR